MSEWIVSNEPLVRATAFFSILILMMVIEVLAPKRRLQVNKYLRWSNNIALVVFNTVLIRLLLPVATVGVAIYASGNSIGLFNIIGLPSWIDNIAGE